MKSSQQYKRPKRNSKWWGMQIVINNSLFAGLGRMGYAA
jgi:hypothetical protein